jgi:hypothetical protein
MCQAFLQEGERTNGGSKKATQEAQDQKALNGRGQRATEIKTEEQEQSDAKDDLSAPDLREWCEQQRASSKSD